MSFNNRAVVGNPPDSRFNHSFTYNRLYLNANYLSYSTISPFDMFQTEYPIICLSVNSFFIISPTDQQVHCWSWIKKHMPNDPQLHLEDVSWKYTGKGDGSPALLMLC